MTARERLECLHQNPGVREIIITVADARELLYAIDDRFACYEATGAGSGDGAPVGSPGLGSNSRPSVSAGTADAS
jgi:hypothetical protein